MPRTYRYIGSADLAQPAQEPPQRACVQQPQDVLRWMRATGQRLDAGHSVVATFIVDSGGRLWIADRHSEHVQCARGQDVLAAGEMTFSVEGQEVEVSAVTNQSTGYCPEPESWPAVAGALERAALPHPPALTTEFIFRRCGVCGTTNVVKDGWFECGVCQSVLPARWNYSQAG